MAAREDVNPNGRSLAALYGPAEGAGYAYTRMPGRFCSKFFNDPQKRDNSPAVTLTRSNKDLRTLYVPHKCRP
jgi:hypothetical protein